MRAYSQLPGLTGDAIAYPPDSVQTLLMTGGSSAQNIDWPTSTGGTTAARTVSAHIVRFTGISTAGAQFNFYVNLVSSHAAVPSSGTSVTTGTTAGSTGNSIPVLGSRTFQIPAWSTGFSVAAPSSGLVHIETWKR